MQPFSILKAMGFLPLAALILSANSSLASESTILAPPQASVGPSEVTGYRLRKVKLQNVQVNQLTIFSKDECFAKRNPKIHIVRTTPSQIFVMVSRTNIPIPSIACEPDENSVTAFIPAKATDYAKRKVYLMAPTELKDLSK